MRPDEEVQRADPRARRIALLAVAVVAVAGGTAISLLQRHRADVVIWLDGHAALLVRHPEIVAAAAFVFMLPLAVPAIHLWRLGARIVGAARFPPPGLAVVRDTPVLTGERAVVRGRLLRGLALVIGGSVAAVPLALAWVVRSLVRS